MERTTPRPFSFSGTFALGYPVLKDRHTSAESGVATGIANAIAYVGPTLLPIVMGAALDADWTGRVVAGSRAYTETGYRVALVFAALAGVLALCCVTLSHRRENRRKATPTVDILPALKGEDSSGGGSVRY